MIFIFITGGEIREKVPGSMPPPAAGTAPMGRGNKKADTGI